MRALVLRRVVRRTAGLALAAFGLALLAREAPLAAFLVAAFLAAGLRAAGLRAATFFFVPVVRFVLRLAGARLAAALEVARFGADVPSADHLPDITRWAASATASAISEPSLVALAIMLLAAVEALSAASRPASRIARRALGLALIAAAAAASPAASISLLIAALASLSTVVLLELDDDLEELFLGDFAIAFNSLRRWKDTLAP